MIHGALAAAGLLALAGAPSASATIIDNSHARDCVAAAQNHTALKPALRRCDRALRSEGLSAPDRAATLVNRGIIQMQADRLVAAIADFDAAIAQQPDIAEAYVNKGIALLRQGNRDDEARDLLSQGIDRHPVRPEIAYYQRAIANEGLGRVRDAYEDYSRAAALAPDWADPAEQLQRFQMVHTKTLMG